MVVIDEKIVIKVMNFIKVKYEVFIFVLDFEEVIGNKIMVYDEDRYCNFDIGM